ncbi:MAG: hypothetical protein IPJ07_07010 [Acidobacteria bacterium]|nr:hypothetical protein [Acidobacteriota bacterium]
MIGRSLFKPAATIRPLTFIAALSICWVTAPAQTQNVTNGSTPPSLAPGTPIGTYPLSEMERYNAYTRETSLQFPLGVSAGRGSAGFTRILTIGRRKWTVDKSYNVAYGWPIYTPTDSWWNTPVDFYKAPRMLMRRVSDPNNICLSPSQGGPTVTYTLTRLTFTAPDGTEFEFRDAATGGQKQYSSCSPGVPRFNRGTLFRTADGAAATFIASSDVYDATNLDLTGTTFLGGDLYLSDGTRYHFRNDDGYVEWIRDRNGNRISFSYRMVFVNNQIMTTTTITDSLNRQVVYESGVTEAPYGTGMRVTFSGFGGAVRKIFVTEKQLSQQLLRNTQAGDSTAVKTYAQLFALNGAYSNAYDPYLT